MNNKIDKLALLTLEEKNDYLDWAIEEFDCIMPSKYICLELSSWITLKSKGRFSSDIFEDLVLFPELYKLVKKEVITSGSHFEESGEGVDMGVIRLKDNKYRRDLLIQLKKDINK
jgi:hypothetical protein